MLFLFHVIQSLSTLESLQYLFVCINLGKSGPSTAREKEAESRLKDASCYSTHGSLPCAWDRAGHIVSVQ